MSHTTAFPCRCGDNRESVDRLVEAAVEYLDTGAGWAIENAFDANEIVSGFIWTLQQVNSITIQQIGVDMWFGMRAETYGKDETYYVQCDRIEDGLAWLMLYKADKLPDEWKGSETVTDDDTT